MFAVSGPSLPLVSVSDLLCILVFELSSEYGANVFYFSGYFCSSDFGVM